MSADRGESGFTLVELLVATVVSGIIIAGIASILIVTLQSYPRSAAKLSVSENAQLLSTWLVPDVQSADGAACGIQAPPAGNGRCSPPACAAPDDKLRLTWSDAAVVNTTWSADYCLVGSQLIRYYQQNGKPMTQTVVSRNIAAGGILVLTGTSPPIDDGPAVPTIDGVDVQVTTTDLVNGTPYRFDVSASRRTPALRIYPVPDINFASAATRPRQRDSATGRPGQSDDHGLVGNDHRPTPDICWTTTANGLRDNIDWPGPTLAASGTVSSPSKCSPPATVMSARRRRLPTRTPPRRRQRSPSSHRRRTLRPTPCRSCSVWCSLNMSPHPHSPLRTYRAAIQERRGRLITKRRVPPVRRRIRTASPSPSTISTPATTRATARYR